MYVLLFDVFVLPLITVSPLLGVALVCDQMFVPLGFFAPATSLHMLLFDLLSSNLFYKLTLRVETSHNRLICLLVTQPNRKTQLAERSCCSFGSGRSCVYTCSLNSWLLLL